MRKEKLLLFIIITLCAVTVSAQFFRTSRGSDKNEYYALDYALFKSDSAEKIARLEVYYQIFNATLSFEEIDNAFEAEYEISIDLFKKNKKYDSYQHSQLVRVKDKRKTTSKTDYRTNQVNFMVEEGKYEVIARLYDPIHNIEKIKKFKVKVKKYKNKKPKISDIELIQAIAPSTEEGSVFDKGSHQLIPSVRHKYGTDKNMSIYFYMEIYQGSEKFEDVKVETVLRHDSKGMLYRDSLTTAFEGPVIRQFREIAIEDLRPGHYELIITLRGKRNKKITTKYKDFEIAWTPQALIKYDYKMLIKQIEIIASKEEVNALKGKETYTERLEAINAYWEKQDPTPGTYENEAKSEFYRRIAVANINFSYLFGNGWKTDRGRIYIMYGEPDQIDDYPVVPEKRPYQEWHYYHGSKYLRFVFVDVNEDCEYRLIYPYDGLFQRY